MNPNSPESIDLYVSGKLWANGLIMYDHQTNSLR
jgi:hypothetical protein